jgi:hypothetical protein
LREHPAAVAAARHRLAVVPAAPVELDDRDVGALRTFCRNDRISGLLAGAVRSGEIVLTGPAGTLSTTERVESIDADWQEALRACVLVEALLTRVAARLDAAGIRWLLTKGAALAHCDYPDPSLRTFADVDLLIHPDDWHGVVELLVDDRHHRPGHLEFVHRYGKGRTVLVDDMEVDLHLRFAVGRFGVRCRMRDCFVEVDAIHLGGRRIPIPAAEFRLLHACFHATLGGQAGLRAVRDVAQLALASPATVERTWDIARSWRVEAVVARALSETSRRLRLPADHAVVTTAPTTAVTRTDWAALEVFARQAPFRLQSLTTLSALPLREHPSFAHAAWKMSREHRH